MQKVLSEGIIMKISLNIRNANELEPPLQQAMGDIEAKYEISLPTAISFDYDSLAWLHSAKIGDLENLSRVEIASWTDASVPKRIGRLGELARRDSVTPSERAEYRELLLEIYALLPINVGSLVADNETLVVAPRREGYLLALGMGWLPPGRGLSPNVKRFKQSGRLVVGLDLVVPERSFRNCVLVDGAIASGVSLIAVMATLARQVDRFIVVSAHAASAGVNALRHAAAAVGRPLIVYVGEISGELNDSFYAVVPGTSPPLVVVGDLGDMIAGPAKNMAAPSSKQVAQSQDPCDDPSG
jgi:hypothetical protein